MSPLSPGTASILAPHFPCMTRLLGALGFSCSLCGVELKLDGRGDAWGVAVRGVLLERTSGGDWVCGFRTSGSGSRSPKP